MHGERNFQIFKINIKEQKTYQKNIKKMNHLPKLSLKVSIYITATQCKFPVLSVKMTSFTLLEQMKEIPIKQYRGPQ